LRVKKRLGIKGESKFSVFLAVENRKSVVGKILVAISIYLDFHYLKSECFKETLIET
jgi:hypothetical protein